MAELLNLLTAFGVSAPAGLNAYLPLLIVGLLARFTPLVRLNEPFTWLANEWVLATLTVLLLIEMLADKVPGIDHLNDLIQTVVRPTAGAILFAASSAVFQEIHPAFALLLGVLAAGSVHLVKASARPAVTSLTFGLGTPFLSLAEDVMAALMTLTAILAPALVVVFVLVLAVVAFSVFHRRQRPALS